MKTTCISRTIAAVLGGLALAAPLAAAADVQLPDAVAESFRAHFPDAEIVRLSAEEENGVTVYDFEFRDGDSEKEADIAADGTMLEETLVISTDALPPPVTKTFSAQGATVGRVERIEIGYTIEGGRVVQLPGTVIRYEAQLTRGDETAEITVEPDGKVAEGPEWSRESEAGNGD